MSNYTKATNFAIKDGLVTTDPAKIIKGTEIDNEYNAISSAIASKADVNSPSLTGSPTAPTATSGTNTTQIASTAFVKAAVDTATATLGTMSTQNKTAVDITGGTVVGITDLAVADGGTGASSITANSVILGNGSSALNGNLVAPGTSGNVLTSNGTTWQSTAPTTVKGLGLGGEVWNNLTGTRAANTTYTNSRSYPIMVNIQLHSGSSGSNPSYLYVNGMAVANVQGGGWTGGMDAVCSAIVPPGATYSTNSTSAGSGWWELY